MTNQDNAALVRKLYDAVNGKDLETIAAYGADSSEWLDVPFNFTSTGSAAIIDPWKAWFGIFPDATCEVKSLTVLGDHVVAQGIGRGTHLGVFNSPAGRLEPTGRTMQLSFCDVYRLENGKSFGLTRTSTSTVCSNGWRRSARNRARAPRKRSPCIRYERQTLSVHGDATLHSTRGKTMKLLHRSAAVAAAALIGASHGASSAKGGGRDTTDTTTKDISQENTMNRAATDQNRYVGMWVTADGYIRHELLPGGRYDEARGKRRSAYRGRYTLTGTHIDYVDDTGFTADGDFHDEVLYHAGMVLYREREE